MELVNRSRILLLFVICVLLNFSESDGLEGTTDSPDTDLNPDSRQTTTNLLADDPVSQNITARSETTTASTDPVARGGSKDISRLLEKLFHDYDPVVWPGTDSSNPVRVKVGLGVMAFINLDTREQTLNLHGYVRSLWNDPALVWDPVDYGNVTYIVLPQARVWRPDLALHNALLENVLLGSDETNVAVNYNGTVDWQPTYSANFICMVDVAKYPMDVNICPVALSMWMHDISAVKLELMENHTVLDWGLKNGQFNIAVHSPLTKAVDYDGKVYISQVFQLKITRRPEFPFVSMLLPMVVIGLLGPVSFLIPPDSGEKVSVSLNALLSTTVCVGLVRGDLPDRSDKISSMAVYSIFILVSALISVMGNIAVLLVHRHESLQAEKAAANSRDSSSPTHGTIHNDMNHLDFPCHKRAPPISDRHQRMTYNLSKDEKKGAEEEKQALNEDQVKIISFENMSMAWRLNWFFFAVETLISFTSLAVIFGMMFM